jgi:TonB-linked SusC/RagA family outer membrane protein
MRRFLTLFAVLMLFGVSAFSQGKTVSGTVSDKSGIPIIGATIQVVGTNIGATTNNEGYFSMNVPQTSSAITVSNIGFVTQRISIPSNGRVALQLETNTASLDAVIVTAQGLKTSIKSQGVAQTHLTADQLTNSHPTNIASALSGKVAGLQVSAVSSGVNPSYRLILRGMRSLKGDNNALVVLDNVIVPSSILGNLNPADIDNITVLNGGNAAALYGSDGSNGALIITTKKGSSDGKLNINISNTTSVEQVANMPKMQKSFGSGTNTDIISYTPYENQQYGPRFDGSIRQIGLPIEDGSVLKVPYQWNDKYGKNQFWADGLTNQTDISIANTYQNGSIFASAQFLKATGTVPGEKYNRATVRLNGTQKLASKLEMNYSTYYAQNRYDQTSATSSIFNNVLNTPGQIPMTQLSGWKNDPFANPNGFYNAYYENPYFLADNNRSLTRNDYFVGSLDFTYKPVKWFDITYRMGFNTRNTSTDGTQDRFIYSDYTKSIPEQKGTYKVKDVLGTYATGSSYTTNIVTSLLAHAQKRVNDFKFDLTGAGNLSQGPGKSNNGVGLTSASSAAAINGLVVPGLFNLGNSLNPPTASNSKFLQRSVSLWGKFDVAYKNYLFATITGRNDWVSTLAPENRSFFYPSAQISFVPTDAFAVLGNIRNLDYFKVRGGWSKVGQVNIAPYSLDPTYGQSSGYPYSGQGGYSIGSQIVSPGLKPEITQGYEGGFDVSAYKNRIRAAFTYYSTTTKNQTLSTGVSSATGFTSYLLNVGETSSKGIEASLTVTPIRTDNWFISIGANYAYYDNKVVAISADIDKLALATYGGTTGSYAIAGQQFPVLMGTTHKRDSLGRIIVNPITGYPSATPGLSILGRAGAKDELGLNLEVTYKRLTLAATAAYRGGAVIYNRLGTTFDFSGAGINTVAYDRDRFVIPNSVYEDVNEKGKYIENKNITIREGGSAYWPQATFRTGIDENYVTSADFWKLREISLTYDLPATWFKNGKIGLKGATISAQGRNLLILLPKTNVYTDPEYSATGSSSNAIGLTDLGQTPPSRYIGGTITLKF